MFSIGCSNLLHTLWSRWQHVHGICEERVDGADVVGDGFTQWDQQGVKQMLDVVVNDSLDGGTAHTDTVHLDLTVTGIGLWWLTRWFLGDVAVIFN